MKQDTPRSHTVEAAGWVTISFGLLTALLAIVWAVLAMKGRMDEDLPAWGIGCLLVVGCVFTLLGWGVMRLKRPCAALAGALAGVFVAMQLAGVMSGQPSGSLFFLILPAFVLAGNWAAWREMGKSSVE